MDNLVQEEVADTTEEESDVDKYLIYPSFLPKLRATERQYNH